MNQELLQQQANEVLKKEMGRIGRAGSRIHFDTAENNTQRQSGRVDFYNITLDLFSRNIFIQFSIEIVAAKKNKYE